ARDEAPTPTSWLAATSEGSSAVAGENQLSLLSFSIMQPLDKMAAQIKAYREAWNSPEAKPISDVATNKVAAYTLVHCAETEQQAVDNGVWESVAWWYQNIAQFTLDWELPHLSKEEQDATFPLLKPLMEGNIPIEAFHQGDMIVVGDPDQCFNTMKHYADLGVDELICYVQFGYHSGESTLKTIELLGKEVLPELEKYVTVNTDTNLGMLVDAPRPPPTAMPPSVVLIMADQHRAEVMRCAGDAFVSTPNLDRLASEGVRFSRVSCQGPLCMPARASFLTERYVRDHGVYTNWAE